MLVRRTSGVVLGLLAAAALIALVAGGAAASSSLTLRVMSFNVFYGGDELNLKTRQFCVDPTGCPETLDQVAVAIRASGADVVGLQEGTGNTRAIAQKLGWHFSERLQVISRYPIIDPPGANALYIFVEPLPGRVVAVANVHLPSDPYGPYAIRDGATLAEVLALERSVRLPAIADQVERLPGLAARGIPVFLTGDFNSPSHLDWTPAVAAARDDVPFPVEWPVAKALADAGFSDSFRAVHPDPVAKPGFTWTPGSPEGEKVEVHDRIDWVLFDGPAEAQASSVVGEPGNPNVGIEVGPWPSDHRAVVSTFDATPGEMPQLVAVASRSVEKPADVKVRFHATGAAGERVVIVHPGGSAGSALRSKSTGGAVDGTLHFATDGLAPDSYQAALVDPGGDVVSRSRFWLYAAGAEATVRTSRRLYTSGQPIRVSWTKAPGMKWDWLGIYKAGESAENPNSTTCAAGTCSNGHYLVYTYTHTAIEGSTTFSAASSLVGYTTWPLGPGTYRVRLLVDDGYKSVAVSPKFKVVKP